MAEQKSAASQGEEYVVLERTKTSLSDLWKKEDWMAIWMGFLILIVGILIFLPEAP